MVRLATQDDLCDILRVLEQFRSEYADGDELSDRAEMLVQVCIAMGTVFVSMQDGKIVGTLVGVVTQHPFLDRTIAQELAWYAPGGGYRLLKEFEKRAKELGADDVIISTLVGTEAEHLPNRMGYTKREIGWIKKG